MKNIVYLLVLFRIIDIAIGSRKSAKFISETVINRPDISKYRKIGTSSYFGLFGQNSKAKCTIVCLHENDCISVHMDGGACVFGASGDVTSFKDGEEAHPVGGRKILVKRMS